MQVTELPMRIARKARRLAHPVTDRFRRPSTKIRLYYWNYPNFGDQLSPLIIERLFNVNTVHAPASKAELLSIGSIIEHVDVYSNKYRPFVWGSGLLEDGPPWSGPKFIPAAVRGRLTRGRVSHLSSTEIPLGDPGILAPLVFTRPVVNAPRLISLVPHMHEANLPIIDAVRREHPEVQIVDVRDPVDKVVDQIATSSFVCSSSLHGLVIADAYGIPNMWTPLSERVEGTGYKFRDYYSAYGLDATSLPLAEALARVEELTETWSERPNLDSLQEGLIAAFPAPLKQSRRIPRL